MVYIVEQDIPVLFVDLQEIGDEPSAIIPVAVEVSKLEIPSVDLEKMEFLIFYCLELQLPLLDLIKKQR